MDVPATQRLSFKLARQAVLIAVLLSGLLSLLKITLDYVSESAAIDAEVHALLELAEQPASRIAYNLDYDLAQELADGLLSSPGVIFAAVEDNFDKQLGVAQRPALRSQYRALSDFLFGSQRSYQIELIVAEQGMGRLFLEVDTFAYGQSFLRRAWLSLLTGFAHALAMSGILLIVFYSQLTKPLKKIIRDISNQDLSQSQIQPLDCPARHSKDELGVLVAVTNQQLTKLNEQTQQRLVAEHELTLHLNALEQLIAQRTAELEASNQRLLLSNQALELAREQALQTAQARSTFLANMSHEIRTPLNGLLGMLALSLDGPLSAEQRQQLGIAQDSGKMLMTLLNDALDLSKYEAGQLQLERIAFDPGQLVEEATCLLSQNAQAEVELSCRISPNLPKQVEGDPTRFRQIVMNLLSNALKFTAQGSVTLCLDYQQQQLKLSVSDTGIGISAAQQQRIFEPFTQARADISRQYGGTGLGLALTLRLCEAMGGKLELESTESVGSRFSVALPLPPLSKAQRWPQLNVRCVLISEVTTGIGAWLESTLGLFGGTLEIRQTLDNLTGHELIFTDHSEQVPLLRSRVDTPIILLAPYHQLLDESVAHTLTPFAQRATPLTRAGLLACLQELLELKPDIHVSQELNKPTDAALASILLVEDNSINQLVAQGILTKLGYRVGLANNGVEALQQLQSQHFDLVFMDCNMPVMNGYEACRQIRQHPQWQDLPVIALTANAFNEERERCQQAGMNDHLAKPFRKEDLEQVVVKWLS